MEKSAHSEPVALFTRARIPPSRAEPSEEVGALGCDGQRLQLRLGIRAGRRRGTPAELRDRGFVRAVGVGLGKAWRADVWGGRILFVRFLGGGNVDLLVDGLGGSVLFFWTEFRWVGGWSCDELLRWSCVAFLPR